MLVAATQQGVTCFTFPGVSSSNAAGGFVELRLALFSERALGQRFLPAAATRRRSAPILHLYGVIYALDFHSSYAFSATSPPRATLSPGRCTR